MRHLIRKKGENSHTNPKHEAFVRGLFDGKPAKSAYVEAGYEFHEGNASRLRSNGQVQARLTELNEEEANEACITKARVLIEYARIAFSNICEVVFWDDTGVRLIPSDQLGIAERVPIQELRLTVTQAGVNTTVRMHSKLTALETLVKHLKLFVGESEASRRPPAESVKRCGYDGGNARRLCPAAGPTCRRRRRV